MPVSKKKKTDLNGTIDVSSDEEDGNKAVGLLTGLGGVRRNASIKIGITTKRPVRTASMSTSQPKSKRSTTAHPVSFTLTRTVSFL